MNTPLASYKALLDEVLDLRSRLANLERVQAKCFQVERERDEAVRAMQDSEQQYRDLIEALPQLIWVARPDGWVVYFNQKWCAYTGLTLEESCGHGWLHAFHPDDRPRTSTRWKQATETGESYEIEYRLRRADGSYGWVLGRGLPLRDASGQIVKWFGTCTDIDDQKQAEQTLLNANQRLVEAERAKSEFFATVSHELRTPLTLILAPIESLLASDYGPLSETQGSLLETVHNNAVRLLQMITGLLDFSKLQAGKIEVRREPTPVVAMTRTIMKDFEPLLAQKGVAGRIEADPEEVVVGIDRYLYERIVFNLLSNAVKFTPKGGAITVRLAYSEDQLRLEVADTGIGIAAADLPNLFQKFHQLEGSSTRRFEGTGLGLSLVKEFVGLLEGTATVASQVGEGTTFSVAFLAPPSNTASVVPASIASKSAIAHFDSGLDKELPLAEGSGPRILIAEDNAGLASYIASLLQNLGQIRIAQDGEEALDLFHSWHPDIVLSDVMMPRRDGLSLCRELKANPKTSGVPVVLLTALTHRDALLKGWEAGANDYLFKPFHPKELITRMTALIETVRERQRADEAEREARQVAEAANRAKSVFLANMSHELRTPLNGILGYAQILMLDQTLSEPQRSNLNVIKHSGEHLLTLINEILDSAKIEAGKLELSLTEFRLAPFLDFIAEIIGVRAAQKDLEFVCDLAPDLPSCIRGDEQRLRQVLLNLLDNAVKFTKRGRVCLLVRGSRSASSSSSPSSSLRLRFEVQDTGVGIGPDQLESIFQPFEQVGEMQMRVGGTGLGLAISRQLVRLMGGDIKLESRVGQGSTLWFELDVPVVEIAAPTASPALAVTGYQGPRKKILVVDDAPSNRAVLVDILGPLGFELAEAENGRGGLELAQSWQPDLILMDLRMPEMDGVEATRSLSRLPNLKEVPIIAISASAPGYDQAGSLAAGLNAFLSKPDDYAGLLAEIGRCLHLDWIYGLPPAESAEPKALEPLLAPPARELATLHELARLGNMHEIQRELERIEKRDALLCPFAEQLRLLTKSFQSKAVLRFVERYLEV